MNIHLTLKNKDITMENIEGDETRIVAIYHSLYQFLVKCLRTMESKDIDTLQYLNKYSDLHLSSVLFLMSSSDTILAISITYGLLIFR